MKFHPKDGPPGNNGSRFIMCKRLPTDRSSESEVANMPAGKKWRLVLMLFVIACVQRLLFAEIGLTREYRGRQVSCWYGGLMGVGELAGTEGHARVFTGTVIRLSEVGDTDKLLEIVPDEVFVGDFSFANAITNQACLNYDIEAGDRWLLYLDLDPRDGHLFLAYQSASKPIVDAQDDISMLRDLRPITDKGIIIGTVKWMDEFGNRPIRLTNHRIIARDVNSGAEYSTFTNENANFKFDLPEGTYDIAPAPEDGLVHVDVPMSSMKGSIFVHKRKCWRYDFFVKAASKQ